MADQASYNNMSDEEQTSVSDTSQTSELRGQPVLDRDTCMSDQFGPEMCQGHPRSTCPPPETRSFSRNSDYAAPDSSRSSASSQDQSRSFTKAPRSNFRKPEYETESDDSSQGLARAFRRLHMPKSQSATTGPGSTKRKRVEVESDDLDEAQME